MNVDAAIQYLDEHAVASSTHQCATAVRRALAAGGTVINPHPRDAKDYGPFLRVNGFRETSLSGYTPRKGDVAVIQPYAGGSTAGHITMFNGSIWVSDFRQTDMWAGPGYRRDQPSYAIFRPSNLSF